MRNSWFQGFFRNCWAHGERGRERERDLIGKKEELLFNKKTGEEENVGSEQQQLGKRQVMCVQTSCKMHSMLFTTLLIYITSVIKFGESNFFPKDFPIQSVSSINSAHFFVFFLNQLLLSTKSYLNFIQEPYHKTKLYFYITHLRQKIYKYKYSQP